MRYANLLEFQQKNGHCVVPKGYGQEDKALGCWVSTQRKLHSTNDKMRKDSMELLDEIGFVWKVDPAVSQLDSNLQWNLKYAKLLEFKQKNGHCIVPRRGYE